MKKRKNSLFPFLSFLLSCVFLFSAGMIVQELVIREKEKTAFASLSALVADTKDLRFKETSDLPTASFNDPASPGAETEHNSLGSETMPKAVQKNVLPQYAQLYEMNPDFFGWITIDETNINYPVMYTPDRPEYYLHRAFDGSSSNSGVPFVEENCPPDGNYYLIYGHHMKNKTMFGQLPLYASQEYCEEHPIIHFDTLYEQRDYQIIAAFYSQLYSKEDTSSFHYYEYTNLQDAANFDEYIRQVQAVSLYNNIFEVSFGNELLALSTCDYHVKDGRFVVVAKRIDNSN